MSRSAQPSGLGNHALVRWSKRIPCMRMRDGLRVALLAGCSACACHVHGTYHSSHLSCWPVCVWTSAACLCSDVMSLIRMGYTWHYHDIKHTHSTWHTLRIHMAYTSYTHHTHALHVSNTCHTHALHVSYTCPTHVTHMSYTCPSHVRHMSYT